MKEIIGYQIDKELINNEMDIVGLSYNLNNKNVMIPLSKKINHLVLFDGKEFYLIEFNDSLKHLLVSCEGEIPHHI